MTTLATLRQEISEDLDRFNIDNFINAEVEKAIRHYQRIRFYFNETRDETFNTTIGQKLYSVTDDTAIPEFIEIDQIVLMDGTEPCELCEITPKEWEMLTASSASTGRPNSYCYFNRSLGFYPIPDQEYTIRPIGHIMKASPADDAEDDNVWMLEAFDLLRARVCAQLCQRKLRDPEGMQIHRASEIDELTRLNSETNTRVGTGFLTPTEF